MGKTIVITGSTDGIGRQTALEMARLGHRIIVHGRNEKRGRDVVDRIRSETGRKDAMLCLADLSSMRAVAGLARELRDKVGEIDVLINNAGVWDKTRHTTVDGYERTLAVNFLAPFALTNAVLELLEPRAPARVVNVAALVHAERLALDNIQGDRKYSAWDAYARSKLYLIMFGYALARRVSGRGITVNALHPGVIETKMLRKTGAHGSPVEVGARRLRFAALDPKRDKATGEFLVSDKPHGTHAISHDKDAQDRLWATAEALVRKA